jgi:hypothetical protein
MDERQAPISTHNRYVRLHLTVVSTGVDVGRAANLPLRTEAHCVMRFDRVAIKALPGGIK